MAALSINDFKQVYCEFTKRESPNISEGDRLDTLNLDSLAMLEVIGLLEEKAGVEVDEDDLVELETFADLLRVVNSAEAI
ncbi:MAG: acyl carrier protein [Planctomycetes bacterium]|nr:acyl carrier protein [Planctomycetota bacterium]